MTLNERQRLEASFLISAGLDSITHDLKNGDLTCDEERQQKESLLNAAPAILAYLNSEGAMAREQEAALTCRRLVLAAEKGELTGGMDWEDIDLAVNSAYRALSEGEMDEVSDLALQEVQGNVEEEE